MCGRFALDATEKEIVEHFQLKSGLQMVPRFNIPPSQVMPVIKSKNGVEFMQWGLIPHWAKSQGGKPPRAYANARVETIEEKPTFKFAFKKNRCLVPVTGYYEWKTLQGRKHPFYIHNKSNPLMAFAGIFSTWQSEDGTQIETFSIITTESDGVLKQIHERMPIILEKSAYDDWLNQKINSDTLCEHLLEMDEFYPVSTQVNRPDFDCPQCILSL